MDRKLVLEEINGLVEIITEQTGTIMTYPGKIPHIELDIVLSNIRKLYENYHLLSRLNTAELPPQLKNPEKAIIEPAPKHAPLYEAPKPTMEAKPQTYQPINPPIKSVEAPIQHPEPQGHIEQTSREQPPKEPFKPINPRPFMQTERPMPKKEEKPLGANTPDLFSGGSSTLADKLKDEKPSVADRISQGMADNSVANRLQQKPLADIRAAIGINEKFLFINELFNGNLNEYNQAIQALNTAQSIERGLEIFEAYRSRYGWNPKLASFLKLRDLVERRYL
jgi:hypothetical protein